MAHDHHHHGDSLRDYFTEQLLNILVVGAFGFVAITMYYNGMAKLILNEQFFLPLLLGGIGVLGVVLIRAISVWREAGEMRAHAEHHHHHAHEHEHKHQHEHEHQHGPDCKHDHAHDHHHNHAHAQQHSHAHAHSHAAHGHAHSHADHGHSHDLSWTIARMLILFFPIALFLLDLPNPAMADALARNKAGTDTEMSVLSEAEMAERAQDAIQIGPETRDAEGRVVRILRPKQPPELKETTLPDGSKKYEPHVVLRDPVMMQFKELNDAANDDARRESLNGETVVVEGRMNRITDKQFSLYRMKMTCCSADTVPLKVRMIAPQALTGYPDHQWVRVTGKLEFHELGEGNQKRYIPVIRVPATTEAFITKIKPLSEYE